MLWRDTEVLCVFSWTNLRTLGVYEVLYEWFVDYHSGQFQRVVLSGVTSPVIEVHDL